MSISFDSDCQKETYNKDESCLCAQTAPCFSDFFNGEDTPQFRQELKENADPNCPFCKGTGIEVVPADNSPTMNLANDNAELLLKALGLKNEPNEITIPEARRALMRARSRGSLKDFTRTKELLHGKPREIEPGVFEMAPMRFFDAGVDEEKMKEYIDRFAEFLSEVIKRGATKIFWW